MSKMKKILWILFIFFIFNSCVKYSFKGSLPGYLKTIYIPFFEDEQNYPGAAELITQKVTERFLEDNTLQIINDKKNADLILNGKIVNIVAKPDVIVQGSNVTQNRLTVSVQIECYDTHTQKPLWKGTITKDAPYETDYQPALEEVFSLISEEIVNKTIAAW